jgi:hypothetical protein
VLSSHRQHLPGCKPGAQAAEGGEELEAPRGNRRGACG